MPLHCIDTSTRLHVLSACANDEFVPDFDFQTTIRAVSPAAITILLTIKALQLSNKSQHFNEVFRRSLGQKPQTASKSLTIYREIPLVSTMVWGIQSCPTASLGTQNNQEKIV